MFLHVQTEFLDEIGKPIVDAISGFLTGNPVTAAGIQMIADDPNVQSVIQALKGVTDVIAPVEVALLVCSTAQPYTFIISILFEIKLNVVYTHVQHNVTTNFELKNVSVVYL